MVYAATYGYTKVMLRDAFLCSEVYNKMISPPEPTVSLLKIKVLL